MAYTPKTWVCGETITADGLNNIEEGIQDALECCESGGDCGYECVTAPTEIINEDVTTYTTPGPFCQGSISYSGFIDADTITVEFNGQEYELTKYHDTQYGYNYYGGQNVYDFSQNPFVIQSSNSYNNLCTPSAGTYSLKVVATVETISATECFQKAVKFFGLKYVADADVEGGVLANNVGSNTVTAQYALAEGQNTIASGVASHAEGDSGTTASGIASHAEGSHTTASGMASHTEGLNTTASGMASHTEGQNTTASGSYSHAEGNSTRATASGIFSCHAEGYSTEASGNASHAEGQNTTASGNSSHAEGHSCVASGEISHAEGDSTTASGTHSHVEGYETIANHDCQHAFGEWNVADPSSAASNARGTYIEIVGNGTQESNRSNARTLDWNGNETIAGTLTQSSDKRLKEHIGYLGDDAVEFIKALKPVYYTKDNAPHVGFYAQDVAEADKWECMTGEMNGYMTLGYTELIAPLVAYCQYLEKRIEELENK